MTYNFDVRGNLSPYELIRIDSLEEFEQIFVTPFPLSGTRLSIYTGLLEYIEALGDTLNQVTYTGSWQLWIDGSFTTNKLNPNDVDILSLLDDEASIRQNKDLFEPLFAQNAFQTYQTDSYFLLNNDTAQ
ncbi:hypothetical protein EXU85_11715 [Spirosoma sp. KCTC 42546]|uniref:DUF6932 family protein n=1 Tax=Spirosoma sp. KCTC 42546 TaxID=2520506 RepID=UPI001158D6B0|nr:hypothetical protein [Spirosoma sp. KCTC 42546]QDK79236.1 hypothetical protein EXU85_11715 [Spirosoma sp. KCTC 42546]